MPRIRSKKIPAKTRRHPKPSGGGAACPGVSSREMVEAVRALDGRLHATLDLGGRIVACDEGWSRLLPPGPAAIVGRPLLDLVQPADRVACRLTLQHVLAAHAALDVPLRFGAGEHLLVSLRLAGEEDAIELAALPLTTPSPRSSPAADAARVLDAIEEGVLVADATRDGLPITFVNRAFSRLTGHPAAGVLGRPLTFAADPTTDRTALDRAIAEARAGDESTVDVCCARSDGASLWTRLTLSPERSETGEVVRLIAVHLDISERRMVLDALREKNHALTEALESLKKTREAIVQRERMHALGKMAGGIVHDFNNLLSPILGFTELLLSAPPLLEDRERVASYLAKIRTAATDGAAVVARLREFYRTREDAEPAGECLLHAIMGEVIDLTRHRWKNESLANGIEVEVITDLEETPSVRGSEAEIRQAMTNLVLNAIDAMPEGGALRVRTYRVGNWSCIQISDSGTGMNAETRRRCFEPFFTTKGKAGTGLGLAIVFGTIERHAGRVELDSVEGHGTTFTIRFPISLRPAPVATDAVGALPATRPLRILLVDDEDLLLEVVSEHLTGMGHTVDCQPDPQSALKQVFANAYDLVITDRAMPRMNGDQLSLRIRELRPSVPIILLTGFGCILEQTGEAMPGISEVVSKPISRKALAALLERHCGASCGAACA